jgi:hypothetical protein
LEEDFSFFSSQLWCKSERENDASKHMHLLSGRVFLSPEKEEDKIMIGISLFPSF